MISSIGSNNYLSILQQTGQASGVSALLDGGADPTTSSASAGSASGDSAKISGPGQLFSELKQLQAQDPTKFKQVASDIASQLQTAAQSATGNQAQFLGNLADKFQQAATTGDVSSLQPQHHGHHGHHVQGTYNQQGQVSTPSAVTPAAPTGDTGATDIAQLFANISKEVASAVSV